MPADLLSRFLSSLGATWLPGLGLLLLAAVAVLAETRGVPRLSPGGRRIVRGAALLLGLAAALVLAWRVLWLCDDAFISFRYARNLAEGHGLVFNPGERVEGYTNFLWTALLGGVGWLGASIPHAALLGNLLAFAGAIVLAAVAARRASPEGATLPLAALALAGSGAFAVWGSSGLETMPAAFLVVAAMAARGPVLAGLFLALAALTRPDHVLLVGAMGVALVAEDLAHGEGRLRERLDLRRYVRFALPFALLFVPWFLGRWAYYGDLFPNTYYAKSGGASYVSQGLVYGAVALLTTGAWLFLPAFAVALAGRPKDRGETRLRVFALLALVLLGGYAVKVGGDFMQNRFFASLLAPLLVAAEAGLRWRFRGAAPAGRRAIAALGVLALAGPWLPVEVIGPKEKYRHVATEESFYPVRSVFPLEIGNGYFDLGNRLGVAFADRGIEPRLAFGCVGMVGWYGRVPLVDSMGLTSRAVARLPVGKRGRPGHEKRGGREVLRSEGAVLELDDPWGAPWNEAARVRVDGIDLWFLRWDEALAARLRRLPGARVPDPAAHVRKVAATEPRERVLGWLHLYEELLADAAARETIVAPIRKRLGSIADFEDGLPPEARVEGGAFAVERAPAPGPHRDPRLAGRYEGAVGPTGRGWLSSRGRAGTGRVELPLHGLPPTELRLVLGGEAGRAILALEDGTVLEAAADGRFRPVAFDLRGHAGGAILTLVDDDPAPARGLVVDAVHLPGPGDVRERLAAGDSAALLREAESLLPPEALAELPLRLAGRWNFEDGQFPGGAEVQGDAFGRRPVAAPPPGQQAVDGKQGERFLSSFHGGDEAKGRIALPPFSAGGKVSALVGGGRDCRRTFVGVEVGGRVVVRACGRDDETLRPVLLDTARWAGQEARVVIVDDAAGPWGHVLADDVIAETPPAATPAAGVPTGTDPRSAGPSGTPGR